MRIFPFLAVLPAMTACTASEFDAAVADPSAFSCRERAVATMSVPFDATSSQAIGTDIFGTQRYDVFAAGQTFRCTVIDGTITGFSRV